MGSVRHAGRRKRRCNRSNPGWTGGAVGVLLGWGWIGEHAVCDGHVATTAPVEVPHRLATLGIECGGRPAHMAPVALADGAAVGRWMDRAWQS